MAKKGGKKAKRGKKGGNISTTRELVLKDESQEYGQVVKMLGDGRLLAFCFDGKERICHIRGKMKKRIWIQLGDIILISLRDFQDNKADVIMKYWDEEARQLKNSGQLPMNAKINEGTEIDDEPNDCDEDIEFDVDAI